MAHLALANLVLDVTDIERAALFWREALGYEEFARSPLMIGLQHPTDARRFRIGFQRADDAHDESRAASRARCGVHVDLETDDRAAEVARLEKLGATRVEDWEYPMENPMWTVMRDPDGYTFCVSQRPASRSYYADASA